MKRTLTLLLLVISITGFSQSKYRFGKVTISNKYIYDTMFGYCKIINDTIHLTKAVKVIEIDGDYFNVTRSVDLIKQDNNLNISPINPIGRWFGGLSSRLDATLPIDTTQLATPELFKKHPEWFQLKSDTVNNPIRDTVYSTYDKKTLIRTGRDYFINHN